MSGSGTVKGGRGGSVRGRREAGASAGKAGKPGAKPAKASGSKASTRAARTGSGRRPDPGQPVPFEELVPMVERHARKHGLPTQGVLALLYRESTFNNWGWHRDGTGCGLAGLDLGGLLPEFARRYGLDVDRRSPVCELPVEEQLEFVTQKLGELSDQYGGFWNAARVWHAGPANRNSSRAQGYVAQLKEHMSELKSRYESVLRSLKDALPSRERVDATVDAMKEALGVSGTAHAGSGSERETGDGWRPIASHPARRDSSAAQEASSSAAPPAKPAPSGAAATGAQEPRAPAATHWEKPFGFGDR